LTLFLISTLIMKVSEVKDALTQSKQLFNISIGGIRKKTNFLKIKMEVFPMKVTENMEKCSQ